MMKLHTQTEKQKKNNNNNNNCHKITGGLYDFKSAAEKKTNLKLQSLNISRQGKKTNKYSIKLE